MRKINNFERWVSETGLLNTTLAIWVLFLMHTYTRILWRITPHANDFEKVLNVIESIALGLVTFLIIRRAKHMAVKILFAIYEFAAVYLYYDTQMQSYLVTYLALLCSSSIFGLGYISTQSYKEAKEKAEREDEQVNSEIARLTSLLTENEKELLKTQSLVTQSQSAINQKEKEVTSLQDKVSDLQNAVDILTKGVTEKEAKLTTELNEAYAQIQQQTAYFNAFRAQAEVWKNHYDKWEQANAGRSQKQKERHAQKHDPDPEPAF